MTVLISGAGPSGCGRGRQPGAGAVPGPGLGRDGGEPGGEVPPFGPLGVQCCLGALGPGNGGGCELLGGFLPCLAGCLDRGGLPFGLPAGGRKGVLAGLAAGEQVRGGALRAVGCGVAFADGGVTKPADAGRLMPKVR